MADAVRMTEELVAYPMMRVERRGNASGSLECASKEEPERAWVGM